MTPEELWRTTPRDFRVIVEAKIEQRDQEWKFYDVLNGKACSTLVNLHLKKGAPAYKPVDFMITKRETETDKETDPMKQTERIYEQFHTLSLMTGGGKR
jgi:hypothetical protein